MIIPRNKTIKVFWHDHTSDVNWATLPDLRKTAKIWYSELCTTIGKCIINEKKYIVVASESDGADEHGNYTMIIKSAIEKIQVL